jgi:hypothetical protein
MHEISPYDIVLIADAMPLHTTRDQQQPAIFQTTGGVQENFGDICIQIHLWDGKAGCGEAHIRAGSHRSTSEGRVKDELLESICEGRG